MALTRMSARWLTDPEERHAKAAEDYLTLVTNVDEARRLVVAMGAAGNETHAAKDLLRASNLPVLPATEPHVRRDLKKIRAGTALSPVLLVRGDMHRGLPLTIADGYLRLCAALISDEAAEVPCRLVDPRSQGTGTA